MTNRFDAFSDREQGILMTALCIAIGQWRRAAMTIPALAASYDAEIRQAEAFQKEMPINRNKTHDLGLSKQEWLSR